MSEDDKPTPEADWRAEAVAAFELLDSCYSFSPCLIHLEKVYRGEDDGYTPPEPVLIPFYRCWKCRQDGGVRWLASRFMPGELGVYFMVPVELEHDFDCLRCAQRFTHLQVT